ncbi:MAG: hypothetical protein ACYTF6_08945 [Planctomycetota bacterium]
MKPSLVVPKLFFLLALFCSTACAELPAPPGSSSDNVLAAARKYVEKSDRYLHHSKLRRGMKGYGLTVTAGVNIVKFDVEIVSVMAGWAAQQDVIIARLSGKDLDGVDLEESGIISGMSGSPVYVVDEADGESKLIGAVCYGWWFQKEPLCGIQPITQMVAVSGFLSEGGGEQDEDEAVAAAGGRASREYLSAVLTPRKVDVGKFFRARRRMRLTGGGSSQRLRPLVTPMMISGASPRTIARARKIFGPFGIVPLQAGSVTQAEAAAAKDAKLEPGASLALTLVCGDTDFSAVGTVTDVVDGKVLALGHALFGEGDTCLPMGTAYVHTVVPGLDLSFKLTSTLKVTGATSRDEYVGVCGRVGGKAPMIPMTVTAKWKKENRVQRCNFKLCRHRWLTPDLAEILVMYVAWGWTDLPEHHTVRYSVDIDFVDLGHYRASNVSSGWDIWDVTSDLGRPLWALMNNPLGPPPEVRRIDVTFEIEPVNSMASILDFKLAGTTYRPGETVTGELTIRRYRKPRETLPISFKLPEDLPEGYHQLTVSDYMSALYQLQSEKPHQFDPRTVKELFESLQRVAKPNASKLYLSLALPGGGIAIDKRELPELPRSKAQIIMEAARMDSHAFSSSLVREVQTKCVVYGSASANFCVTREPRETIIRRQEEDE